MLSCFLDICGCQHSLKKVREPSPKWHRNQNFWGNKDQKIQTSYMKYKWCWMLVWETEIQEWIQILAWCFFLNRFTKPRNHSSRSRYFSTWGSEESGTRGVVVHEFLGVKMLVRGWSGMSAFGWDFEVSLGWIIRMSWVKEDDVSYDFMWFYPSIYSKMLNVEQHEKLTKRLSS